MRFLFPAWRACYNNGEEVRPDVLADEEIPPGIKIFPTGDTRSLHQRRLWRCDHLTEMSM